MIHVECKSLPIINDLLLVQTCLFMIRSKSLEASFVSSS